MTSLLLCFVVVLVLFVSVGNAQFQHDKPDGLTSWKRGLELFEQQRYDEAAIELWNAVLYRTDMEAERKYDVQEAFQKFMECYKKQGKPADGLAFLASELFREGQIELGKSYLQQALVVDPKNEAALAAQRDFEQSMDLPPKEVIKVEYVDDSNFNTNSDLSNKSPEELYKIASLHFKKKNYEECAKICEMSCRKSKYKLNEACANAVYCRSMIGDYGYNGTQHQNDMKRIINIIESETKLFRISSDTNDNTNDTEYSWNRAISVYPHMMIGFPIHPMLKRLVAESAAYTEELKTRINHKERSIIMLPNDLPFDIKSYRNKFLSEKETNKTTSTAYRIRVGFAGSAFNTKAILFLSQDMFRFFDTNDFEIHIFSFGPPNDPLFIQHGMRNVDWRERVKTNVDYFHDLLEMNISKDHIAVARYIHQRQIHILIEWDGYARVGDRVQGLFALRPAPIQISHQENIGTSGATQYIDYIFTDEITSPPKYTHFYTEKFIWLPHHFFSKGHAFQAEVKKPTYEYAPKSTPYKFGTGSPKENRCLSPPNVGPTNVSFVYCNFNKLLKANPETIRSWIRILREVPDSILCLLENPTVAIPYLRKFVHEAAGTSTNHSDPSTFIPGDGEELNHRIHFLSWEKNPYDHQMRNQDFCNVMIDSHPYNGHTVAQDALYGGVPVVTRSDGIDMSARVSTSANIVLGLEQLNAYNGSQQYEDIAIRLGNNESYYHATRNKLIDSCLQRNPMHPYWDVARYVKNFETGLKMVWELFLDGKSPQHIRIQESEQASLGTYDDEILAHPQDRKKDEYCDARN
jgi:protein O-GlcNAc transferase